MEIEILEHSKSKMIFLLHGEDHTFCNPLIKTLQKDSNVKAAAHTIEHPLERVPKVFVETKSGTSVIDVLQKAVESLKKQNSEFLKKFQAAAK